MRNRVLLPVLSLTFASFGAAQEMPAPHATIRALERFAGHYEGAGKLVPEPGAPALEWTAKSSSTAVLGGFAFQGRMIADLGEALPGPYARESMIAFDPESEELLQVTVDSQGTGDVSVLHWAGDGVLVGTSHHMMEGRLVRERTITTATEHGYDVRLEWTIDAGEPFDHVVGSFRRVDKGGEVMNAAAKGARAAPTMAPMAGLVGSWESSGWFLPSSDAPKMNIEARITIEPMLDGHVLRETISGTAEGIPPYEGIAYFWSDPEHDCLRSFGANNYGEVGRSQGWALDNGDLCFVAAGPRMGGVPTTERMLIELDEHGPVRMSSSGYRAGGEGLLYFELNFPR